MAPNRFPLLSDTPTGQDFVGQFGGAANYWQPADAALTRPNNTTAYSAHGAVGSGTDSLLTWSNFFRSPGSSARIRGARITANVASVATSNLGAIRLHLFNAKPSAYLQGGTPLTDQVAFLTLNADQALKQGWIDFATYTIGGTGSDIIEGFGVFNTVAINQGPVPVIGAQGGGASKSLFGILEATGAFTPAALQVIQVWLAADLD